MPNGGKNVLLNLPEYDPCSAQAMKDAKGVHNHLQIVANCLGGKTAAFYEMRTADPCTAMAGGQGMMHAVQEAGGKRMKGLPWLDAAADIAMVGVKATSAEKAKAAAWATQVVLEKAGGAIR